MKFRIAPVLALVGLAGVGLLLSNTADADRVGKVWLCHETSSATNPYVLISVAESAWDGQGKNDHTLHEGDFEASGPDDDCSVSGDDGDGGDDGGDDGGGDGGGGDGGGDDTGEPPADCMSLWDQGSCEAEPACVWTEIEGMPGFCVSVP